jgi:hypothetical protein
METRGVVRCGKAVGALWLRIIDLAPGSNFLTTTWQSAGSSAIIVTN